MFLVFILRRFFHKVHRRFISLLGRLVDVLDQVDTLELASISFNLQTVAYLERHQQNLWL